MIAHIVSASLVPLWATWVAAVALFGGIFLALLRHGRQRRLALGLAAVGMVVTALGWIFGIPAPPPYTVSLRVPSTGARVTTPVYVLACGTLPNGLATAIPGPGYLLTVIVDGHQVSEMDRPDDLVSLPAGHHTITVEVLTSAHHITSPVVSASAQVTVTSVGAISTGQHCP